MNSVAIIGAGISGLSAAYYASKAGCQVVLYEPNELGGVVRTAHIDGFTLERGPNVLLERPELWDLLSGIGMEAQVVFPIIARYKQHVWFNGAVCQVPRSPFKLFSTPLLPRRLKWSLPYVLLKKGLAAPTAEDESVSTYFSRFLGKEVVSNLLGPALQGIYGGDVTKLSARTIFPELWEATKGGSSLLAYAKTKKARRTLVFRRGMSSLIEAIEISLRGKIEIVRQAVTSLRCLEKGRFEVTTQGAETRAYNRVIVTTSGYSSAGFLAAMEPEAADALRGLRFAPIVVVHVSVPATEPVPADSFGVLFPAGHPDALLGVMFNSILFPHTAPVGQHLLTVCLGGINGVRILERSDDEIHAIVRRELAERLSLKSMQVLAVQRWEHAIPQYEVGHWKLVEKLHKLEATYPGLTFLGADLGGVGVPDRIKAAKGLFA